jgi:hypothetical protein
MDVEDRANQDELPTVTVFGAGIAGLTAAHELIERGFRVQVVEPQECDFEEYECAVGGLAANQFARVRASIAELHECLLSPGAAQQLDRVQQFRSADRMEETNQRFPLLQRIRFDKRVHISNRTGPPPEMPGYDHVLPTPCEPADPIPDDWRDYWDDHGTINRLKLDSILTQIRKAAAYYMRLFFPELAAQLMLGAEPTEQQWLDGTFPHGTFSPIRNDSDLARKFVARETLLVRVVGYTDSDGLAEDNRRLANDWATKVQQELLRLDMAGPADLRIFLLQHHLEVVVRGAANPRFDQSSPIGRRQSNRVEFEIVEQVMPGEHGFRFFPAFYRHVFDTMRRTPMMDEYGGASGSTAFDQLVPTPQALLARDDEKGLQVLGSNRLRSVRQLDDMLKLVCDELGFTPRDLLGLQYFTLRYLLSSPARRLSEAESINLLTYLGGPDPAQRFSQAALDFVNRAPRALAAMSAIESDARTQFNITAQLMIAQPVDGVTENMTLNGPTSKAWLDHWKTYLRIQGVRFFVGRIESLRVLNDLHFVPQCEGPNGWLEPRPEDAYDLYLRPKDDGSDLANHRFVLALPFRQASDLIWGAYNSTVTGNNPPAFTGSFRQLIEFDRRSGRRDFGEPTARAPARDPKTGIVPAQYPLRTISGLQYFFPEEYRFGKGNAYFVSAPWALTSISQFAYWRDRVKPVGEFLGQISVDVGDWHAPYPAGREAPNPQPPGHPAWYSSCGEIAQNTWQQIKSGLGKDFAGVIKAPRYFHIDRNIVFGETAHVGFQRSALLRVLRRNELAPHPLGDLLTMKVKDDGKWSRYRTNAPILRAPLSWLDPTAALASQTQSLVDRINDEFRGLVFATRVVEKETDILVSPTVVGRRFVIAFRAANDSRSYIAVNGRWGDFIVSDPSQRLQALQGAIQSIGKFTVRALNDTTFELTVDGEDCSLTVVNVDGAIELLDGPQLAVHANAHVIQLLNAEQPASGQVATASVRANAVLRLPYERRDGAPNGLQAGRLYGIAVGVGAGQADRPVIYEATEHDQPADARRELLALLADKAGDLILAQPVDNTGIVLSPVVAVQEAKINILGRSDQIFRIRIDDRIIDVDGAGKSEIQIRDAVAAAIGQLVDDQIDIRLTSDNSLSLVPLSPDKARTFRIAVLNTDRRIELAHAPVLTVEVKDLQLEAPSEGFVVLRNDAEFLINIPGQWSERPGLCRGAAANDIPHGYGRLAGFGEAGTEIFYGHRNCPLLKYWVSAGTYMATYTRITTMEAANESGRHAASAIISSLLEPGAGGDAAPVKPPILVGDFPQIWKVEDCEPEDLKYFTELDAALVKEKLPHILDILSVTRLVNALLEAELPEAKTNDFLKACKTIFSHLQTPASQGLLLGAQSLSDMVAAYGELTKGILDSIVGNDPLSLATRSILSRQLKNVEDFNADYRTTWFGNKPV